MFSSKQGVVFFLIMDDIFCPISTEVSNLVKILLDLTRLNTGKPNDKNYNKKNVPHWFHLIVKKLLYEVSLLSRTAKKKN